MSAEDKSHSALFINFYILARLKHYVALNSFFPNISIGLTNFINSIAYTTRSTKDWNVLLYKKLRNFDNFYPILINKYSFCFKLIKFVINYYINSFFLLHFLKFLIKLKCRKYKFVYKIMKKERVNNGKSQILACLKMLKNHFIFQLAL